MKYTAGQKYGLGRQIEKAVKDAGGSIPIDSLCRLLPDAPRKSIADSIVKNKKLVR